MPRANRHFVPGQIWHLTQRCINRSFLFGIPEERDRWCYWLGEASRRFGLCVLNYITTSNHIHLLVEDKGLGEIAQAMQLIAGRMGQEFNVRNARSGPFWQDRYHATAVESGIHLARCVVYIDRNMVRANEVTDPSQWRHCGFHEIRMIGAQDKIIDRDRLTTLLGLGELRELREAHVSWHESNLAECGGARDPAWSEALAVGSPDFVKRFKVFLGVKGHRSIVSDSHQYSTLQWASRRSRIPARTPDT
jgi:putative transposase